MKTIRRYYNNAEAGFAQSLLASAGIGAVLAEENANHLGPQYVPFGVRLQVPDEEEARALEILEGRSEEFAPLPDDFVEPGDAPAVEAAVQPRVEGFNNLQALVPAGLCVVGVIGVAWVVFILMAPLNWMHSAAELVKMGNAAAGKEDYDNAVKFYDAALVSKPEDRVAYYDRGLAFYGKRDYEKAVADFTESIKLYPRHAKSYSMRGYSFYKMGRYDEAMSDLNTAVGLDAGDYRNYIRRGLVYYKKSDSNGAIGDFQQAAELAPDNAVAVADQAWIYATWPEDIVRNGARATELAEKACELSRWKDYFCIAALAAAEAETGKYDEAARHGKQALEMGKADKTGDEKLLGKVSDAFAAFQQNKPYRDVKK